ncbi:MAG: hypothetical protein COB98_07595 [Flavobacteriaceae bacterium]|nr:MAG: hypothetical protein COB98_07595 [Flavobacteriaceae bacterium]
MGATELRDKLLHLINSGDENFLRALYDFSEQKKAEEKTEIVAYTVQGEPLTKELYIEKVKKSEAAMKKGHFTTSEDLEKEMLSW